MYKNKVSVIIPCFNNETTIERSILSVSKQTYKNLEIICVNDSSSDNTEHVLNQLKATHSNLIIINNKENSGPSFSRNTGVSISTGNLLAFLDADDFWHEQKLELQIIFMQENHLDFIGATITYEKPKSIEIKKSDLHLKIITFNMMMFKNYFATSSVLMKKDIFIPFNEQQRFSEDYMLWLSILDRNNKCGLIYNHDLVFPDKSSFGISGLSSNLWLMEKNELKNLFFFLGRGKLIAIPAIIVSLLKYAKRYVLTKIRIKRKALKF